MVNNIALLRTMGIRNKSIECIDQEIAALEISYLKNSSEAGSK